MVLACRRSSASKRFPAGFAGTKRFSIRLRFFFFFSLVTAACLLPIYCHPFDCRLTAYFTPFFPSVAKSSSLWRFVGLLFCARLLAGTSWLVVCDIAFIIPLVSFRRSVIDDIAAIWLLFRQTSLRRQNCCFVPGWPIFPVPCQSARQSTPVSPGSARHCAQRTKPI